MDEVKVYLGVGSNVGDRAANIKCACEALQAVLHGTEQASLYETRPREVVDQPLFVNTVVSGYTSLSAGDLLARLNEIEANLGRDRPMERHKGPRTMDIDLLLYGTEIIESDDLTVPHPRICERKFVLVPLLELSPTLGHPATGRTFQSYLEALEPQGIYYFNATRYSRGTSGQ